MSSVSDVPTPAFALPYHPGTAAPAAGTMYRLTTGTLDIGDTPPAGDWVIPINKGKGACAGAGSEAKRACYAHSVYADKQDLEKAQQTTPWARRKSISSLELTCGWVEATPRNGDSHHSWWPDPLTHIPSASCEVKKL